MPKLIAEIFAQGTLAGTTTTQPMFGASIPSTITLKSSDATRAIQLSTDGGTEFFTPTYDTVSATMIIVSVVNPISHVKFTGVATNTWRIQ